jgi:hypothetical protein
MLGAVPAFPRACRYPKRLGFSEGSTTGIGDILSGFYNLLEPKRGSPSRRYPAPQMASSSDASSLPKLKYMPSLL